MSGLLEHIARSSEEWRSVPGYEGLYEASDLGQVRSLDRVVAAGTAPFQATRRGRVLQPYVNRHGYPVVSLSKDGEKRRTISVHKVILQTFRGARPEGLISRHLNGNRLDSRLENLAYGTHSENEQDKVRHGTQRGINQTECKHGHPLAGSNLYVNKRGHRSCRMCRRDAGRRKVIRRNEQRLAEKAS
jgi:hypothetical protein